MTESEHDIMIKRTNEATKLRNKIEAAKELKERMEQGYNIVISQEHVHYLSISLKINGYEQEVFAPIIEGLTKYIDKCEAEFKAL